MPRRKQIEKKTAKPFWKNTAVLVAVVILFFGSLILLVIDDPESVSLASDNGVLKIEGRLIGSPVVSIEHAISEASTTAGLGAIYEVAFEEGGWMPEATMEFLAVGASEDVLWMYDAEELAWIVRNDAVYNGTIFLLERERLSDTSWWAVGEVIEYKESSLANRALNALLSYPPENAIGYKASLSYATAEGDFVMVDDAYDRGGCNGELLSSTSTTFTSQETSVDNGVERVRVLWYLADGCEDGERILPID